MIDKERREEKKHVRRYVELGTGKSNIGVESLDAVWSVRTAGCYRTFFFSFASHKPRVSSRLRSGYHWCSRGAEFPSLESRRETYSALMRDREGEKLTYTSERYAREWAARNSPRRRWNFKAAALEPEKLACSYHTAQKCRKNIASCCIQSKQRKLGYVPAWFMKDRCTSNVKRELRFFYCCFYIARKCTHEEFSRLGLLQLCKFTRRRKRKRKKKIHCEFSFSFLWEWAEALILAATDYSLDLKFLKTFFSAVFKAAEIRFVFKNFKFGEFKVANTLFLTHRIS